MKQMMNKLQSRVGETLAEVLIALLVSTLALMILAGMISSTTNVVKASEQKMDEYYTANGKLENISGGGSATVTITIGTHAVEVPVVYEQNDKLGNRIVTAYRYVAPAAGGSGD